MNKRLFSFAFVLILACSLFASCAGPGSLLELGPGSWVFTELEGTVPTEPAPQLVVDRGLGQASGSTGVNRFSGTCHIANEALSFGALITTRMAGSPEAMLQEQMLLGVLARVDGWRRGSGELELLQEGRVIARVQRARPE